MAVRMWVRWVAMHGVARTFMKLQAVRGDPLARLIASHGHATDPYPLMEEIRARGPLVRTPFTWISVDHGISREVLRDNRFGVTAPSTMDLPRPLRTLITRTDDKGVANPVEPPAMVVVDPPEHTRYRQLVAQSFTPRAIDRLSTRVVEVTDQLIDRLARTPQPDLIADFASQLPVAIIAEILDLDPDTHPWMLGWGHSGAPLLDIGIGWRTYRQAIDSLRGADRELRARFHELRSAGWPPTAR
jgi:cytochrome P450